MNYSIGGLPDSKGSCFNGTVSSVIIFNSLLSDIYRNKVEGYLAWKWCGGGMILPADHPYLTTSPCDIGLQFNKNSYT